MAFFKHTDLPSHLTRYHTIPTFNDPPWKEALENTVGKGENAGNQYFPFSNSVFYPISREIVIIAAFNLSSANASSLVLSKNLSFRGKLSRYKTEQLV